MIKKKGDGTSKVCTYFALSLEPHCPFTLIHIFKNTAKIVAAAYFLSCEGSSENKFRH